VNLIKKTVFIALVAVSAGAASAQSLKGMSLNGATGLVSIPTGRIGWERSSLMGLNLGYHAIMDDDETAHIPKASVSLFKWFELSFAYDTQIADDSEDMIFGGKIQLPTKGTSVAVGGNFQQLKQFDQTDTANQIYIAATYPSTFFKMPAETTVVVGKTFYNGENDDNVDFGMGFDLVLLPDVFQKYIHWVTDFANFSYSAQAVGSNAYWRGSLNTGIRIDIAANPKLKEYMLVIDAMMTDALDENRAFTLGLAAGMPIK
jgi:hypothetical protein